MSDATTERVLRLLGLLQERRGWTGPQLAAALGVTDRCVRRDVTRLRNLGYPVQAGHGVEGGYWLGPGTTLPPLLLDADEAIATTVSLLLAAGGTVTGAAEATVRTLAKLDQVLPPRLRPQVQAMTESLTSLDQGSAAVDGGLLLAAAGATRDRFRIRFAYARADGTASQREVEPSGLVTTGRRWYLLGWDLDREDWRTFRVDRLTELAVTTWRCRQPRHPDPTGFVHDAVTTAPYRWSLTARVHLPPEEVRAWIGPQTGTVAPDPDRRDASLVRMGADDLEWLVARLADFACPVEILEPAEARAAAARMAARLQTMARHER